ncbi:MAG: hypothetical protein AMXMBFR47_11180 [Planctomycetota bacterium]
MPAPDETWTGDPDDIPPPSENDDASEEASAEDQARIDAELESMWRGRPGLFDDLLSDVNLKPSALLRRHDAAPGKPGGFTSDVRGFPSVEGYTLLRQLGAGGMGEVYEAVQLMTQRRVALKIMRATGGDDAHRLELFDREVRVLARLSHPYIATIFAAGQTRTRRPYLAMELISGVNLVDYANARGAASGRLALRLPERLAVFIKICEAIDYAHQRGVVHRDLKPSNILVDEAGQPKVVDFGLASLVGQSEEGSGVGTIRYMSPEQAGEAAGRIDSRSDIYTLGVILYELLTDQPPYRATPYFPDEARRLIRESVPLRPREVNHALPAGIDAITMKALEKSPAKRFRSAGEFADAVAGLMRGRPEQPTFVQWLRRLAGEGWRRRG